MRPLTAALLLWSAALAGCGRSSETPDGPPASAVPPRAAVAVRPQPPAPERPQSDGLAPREIEFDTLDPVPPPAPAPPTPAPPAPAPPPPSGPSGSCDVRPSEGFCFDYEGAGWTPRAARAHCGRAPGAAFGAGTCPEADRVGTCTFERPDAAGQTLVYIYYAPYPVDLARLACPGAFAAAGE